MIERGLLGLLLFGLGLIRRAMGWHSGTYVLLTLPPLQPLLEAIGRLRARAVYLKARAECPAYRDFLAASNHRERWPWRLSQVPVTSKENYVKVYSIESRCYGGALSGRGQVIDESSGSSGLPNNWVRSRSERMDVKRLLQLNYDLIYGNARRILLNCFALGPWATGMNVSMSLADVGILKSIGPDAQKLENTLRVFGPSYRYIVFGYPPFVKSFVDGTGLDLSAYHLDLVVGGEGISENLRAYLRKSFRTVLSSYGASDLEINIAVETEWTTALRSRCVADAALCVELFGRDSPPMIFQFNPLDYLIERLEGGALVYTVCRTDGAAPKLRYDLKDQGGVYTFRDLERKLRPRGIEPGALARRFGHFPVLYVFGRGDLTVAFFGAKLYPSDLEAVILGEPTLASRVSSFQFKSYEDAAVNRRLAVHLELVSGEPGSLDVGPGRLPEIFYRGLAASNQDFREVTRMFGPDAIEVLVHPHGAGPFEGADARIKSRYVGA